MSGWHRAIIANGLLAGTCAAVLLVLIFLAIDVDRGFEENARLRQDVSNSYDNDDRVIMVMAEAANGDGYMFATADPQRVIE